MFEFTGNRLLEDFEHITLPDMDSGYFKKNGYYNRVFKNRCLHCQAITIYRIPRGVLVKLLLFWLPLKHYHCSTCRRNFYRLRKK
ncbi:hypothetical protein [Mucilaginibacter sp. UR6-11]|uniref:hypothetical protein n=1 Tax=Mucilaginibacter sp. UR6-11 TaxID=1435644 RepID=UPI001E47D8EC|nr:hypothetical protein [Mucilaginibacter sp. UR6-11]MCC8425146.1 hypothetical protein [Mucilaginibacter sp. UR6-11]